MLALLLHCQQNNRNSYQPSLTPFFFNDPAYAGLELNLSTKTGGICGRLQTALQEVSA